MNVTPPINSNEPWLEESKKDPGYGSFKRVVEDHNNLNDEPVDYHDRPTTHRSWRRQILAGMGLTLVVFFGLVVKTKITTTPDYILVYTGLFSNDRKHHYKKRKKSLLLLRHAKSSSDDPSLDDFDRPLTPEGSMDAENVGIFLQEHKVEPPQVIYASPSVRTRATLSLVQEHWLDVSSSSSSASSVPVVQYDDKLFNFDDEGKSYLDFVENLDHHYNRVMIVGHNPPIGKLAQHLGYPLEKFPPGSFCEFFLKEWDDSHGKIGLCLLPKYLHSK